MRKHTLREAYDSYTAPLLCPLGGNLDMGAEWVYCRGMAKMLTKKRCPCCTDDTKPNERRRNKRRERQQWKKEIRNGKL